MASSMATQELEAIISAEIARAKRLPVAELAALGESGKTFQIDVLTHAYDINTWSESVPGDSSGAFAVLVGAWSKSFLGVSKRHFKGFVVATDGSRTDIRESDLWQYD